MANERLRSVPERPSDGTVTLVDSNVLLDILTEDPTWSQWSGTALAASRDAGVLVINPIVYAEISVRFDRIEDLDEAIPATCTTRCSRLRRSSGVGQCRDAEDPTTDGIAFRPTIPEPHASRINHHSPESGHTVNTPGLWDTHEMPVLFGSDNADIAMQGSL